MINEKALNEVINDVVLPNVYLQINDVDVAIPYICGTPGGGKTASIYSLCENNEYNILSTHLALKPIEELGGIPQFSNIKINEKDVLGTIWSFPDIMKQLFEISSNKKPTIWLLDDIHLCSATHMALMYELLTERKLREYHLPKNVAIILAGNHGSNKAGAKTMFSAIANRIIFLPIFTDIKSWKKNFAIVNNIHPAILSFLENDKYSSYFHEEEQVSVAWSSPRSWTRLSNMIVSFETWSKSQMKTNLLLYLAEGHIGKQASADFVSYYEIFMKFDIEKILDDIDNYKLPTSMINKYALIYAAISYFTSTKIKYNIIPKLSKLIYYYFNDNPDLALMAIHEIIDIEKLLKRNDIYIKIARELNKLEPGITKDLLSDISSV